jgi:hypothetical protein
MQDREYHQPDPQRTAVVARALEAAGAGQAVFPLAGKAPAIGKREGGRGYKDASRDRSRVTALFNRAGRTATGYGIATGQASRIVVVDVDGPEARAEAERRGLRSRRVVRTGRIDGDGWHIYFELPPSVKLRSRMLAPGLELKAEGAYVVGPGSAHPSGRTYTAVKDGKPSPVPEWILEAGMVAKPEYDHDPVRAAQGPITVNVAGPPIPEGGRNRGLTRIAGKLHDGTRDLDALTRDLEAVNTARCTPPLDGAEVAKIAASIHRGACNPRPEVGSHILALVDALEAVERPIRGMSGASGWAVYMAGLQMLRRYGREHPDGIALSVDVRTWAQMAGTSGGTVSKVIARTPLIRRVERGSGRRSGTVVFVVPAGLLSDGHQRKHSPTGGGVQDTQPRSVSTSAHSLYRARWSTGSRRPLRGVVAGTSRVRQGGPPPRDGRARPGKSRAAILAAVAECGEGAEVSRQDLAERLGRKAASMRAPLRWLVEAGLLVRVRHGHYALPDDFDRRWEDSRELGGEPEADRQQIAAHDRDRDAWRRRGETRPERAPTEREMPWRRRSAIEQAIARLFAERPEYRARSVGQITCALIDHLEPDFPRGQIGVPEAPEVETILDGVAS